MTALNLLDPAYGASVHIRELSLALADTGLEVVLYHRGPLTPCGRLVLRPLSPRQTAVLLPSATQYIASFSPSIQENLRKEFQSESFDLVQIHQPFLLPLVKIAARGLGMPLILSEHNVESEAVLKLNSFFLMPYTYLVERYSLRNSQIVLSVSGRDKALLCARYGVSQSKIFVIPNGVRIKDFSGLTKRECREKLGIPQDAKIALFHGNLFWRPNRQGVSFLLDRVVSGFPDVTFLILGGGESTDLRRKAENCKNVSLMGYKTSIQYWIGAADVCLVPIFAGSGTRLKALEYMAASKPIVSTAKGVEGLRFIHGVHGLVSEAKDVSFRKCIRMVLADEDLAMRLGKNAFELAQEYEWSIIARRLSMIYETNLLSMSGEAA